MLILKRRAQDSRSKGDEQIQLTCPDGTIIYVTLMECHGNHARIGIDAPRSVQIDRVDRIEKVEKRYQDWLAANSAANSEAITEDLGSAPLLERESND